MGYRRNRTAKGNYAGASSAQIEVLRPAAMGQNVIEVGEDVTADQVVLHHGCRLGAAQIGGLMALGITQLRVAKKP